MGCKPVLVVPLTASGSQRVPEDPDMSRQTNKWFMAQPPGRCTPGLYNLQTFSLILGPSGGPLSLSVEPTSDPSLRSGQAVSDISRYFHSLKFRWSQLSLSEFQHSLGLTGKTYSLERYSSPSHTLNFLNSINFVSWLTAILLEKGG